MKPCAHCKNNFEVTDSDRLFYKKLGPIITGKSYPIPEPQLCPVCRQQRRLALRNERTLYARTSSLSGKKMISYHSPDVAFPVYTNEEWFSDSWDGRDFGRDFDFNKPFFEQFKNLCDVTPHLGINIWQSENCDYCNYTDFSHNCYLIFGASNCRDTYYSNLVDSVTDCMDIAGCKKCERCYDCIDCIGCTSVVGSIRCENSHDLAFCFDCKGCEDCVNCFNLSRKKYCIDNEQFSREEYFEKKKELQLSDRAQYVKVKEQLHKSVKERAIHRYAKIINCEACTGDNLTNSKNSKECFESNNLQDCKYVQFSMNSKDTYDVVGSSNKGCELTAEAMSVEGSNIFCGYWIAGLSNVYYSLMVLACENVFGCIGLKHKQYCILNKQYTKEEYEALLPRIIEHMKRTNEWGEFFPISISPFSYNETAAQEYFPVTKEYALSQGWGWKDMEKREKPAKLHSPSSESVIDEVFDCAECFKKFKFISQEWKFYKEMNLPLPIFCPDCRHRERVKFRNPRQLYTRGCSNCGEKMETTFAPERTEIVYCETCYLKEVY